MDNAIIQVKQLPIIEEQLRTIKAEIEKQADEALSLVCNEDTVQTVKSKRAELNKLFTSLEEQRKAVKQAVMGPYNDFEKIYKECVTETLKPKIDTLTGRIDDVENGIKSKCESELIEYFDELCVAHHVEWLTFDRCGIKVDMASAKSKNPKKLKEQILDFVVRVSNDVTTISWNENADELLVEYKRSLNFTEAMQTVLERNRRIEAERKLLDARSEQKAVEDAVISKVDALTPPVVQETVTVTFTVTDTKDRLIALREWMKENNYKYG